MIQFAAVASILPELVGVLSDVIKSPETYEKLEGIRVLLCKLTGLEIDKNGLVSLLEGVTQGEPYTGKWMSLDPAVKEPLNQNHACPLAGRRMRFPGGWLIDIGRANPIFVRDK